MQIITKNQVKEFKNSAVCIATEYSVGDKDLDGAVISLSGRYPDKGRVVNEVCKEMAYIISGHGKVVVEDKKYDIKSEDLILIEKGERYYWEGTLKMLVYCSPVWYPEQHKEVD